jgi:hypothetical protein
MGMIKVKDGSELAFSIAPSTQVGALRESLSCLRFSEPLYAPAQLHLTDDFARWHSDTDIDVSAAADLQPPFTALA